MFEYIIPFFPMLSGYSFHSVSLDFVAMGIFAVLTLIGRGYRVKVPKALYPFLAFFFYVLAKELLIVGFGQSNRSESFHKLVVMAAYICLFLVLATRRFDREKFYKGLKVSGLFYTAGLVYHLFLIYVCNQPAKGISIIPGYEFSNENWLNRPRSFFSEPAALAQAMLPLLFYSLYKKHYKWSLLATVTVVLSTSTMGVVLAGVLWLVQFLFGDVKIQHKVVVAVLMAVMGAVLLQWQFSVDAVAKIQDTLAGGGSTNVRVFLGFELIRYMEPVDWIFGLLYNRPYDFVMLNTGAYPAGSLVRELAALGSGQFFINTFCMIIFRYGIVGMCLYFGVYRGKVLKKGSIGQAFAVMTIVETLGDTMLLNSYYFFAMLLLVLLDQKGQEKADESDAYRVGAWEPDVRLL